MSRQSKKAPKGTPKTGAVAVVDSKIMALGTEKLTELSVKNPAPDSSPSREPSGTYRIISFD